MEKSKKFTLKALRINNGWTQEEEAKLLGLSVATIQNYEAYSSFPDVPVIEKILHLTGMKYDDVIFLPSEYAKSVEKSNSNKET